MDYEMPTVVELGNAFRVIEYSGIKGDPGILETATWQINLSYELDD